MGVIAGTGMGKSNAVINIIKLLSEGKGTFASSVGLFSLSAIVSLDINDWSIVCVGVILYVFGYNPCCICFQNGNIS